MTQPKLFSTLLLDFPWPGQGGERHYDTMTMDEIRAFPFGDLAAPDSHC
jgi:N6-adenosine-specific RNA methylase IME4